MKIILIGPRTFNGYIDGIVWNVQLPLQSLGHEVFLLDTTKGDNDRRLDDLVESVKPDLIFAILSCGDTAPFFEPVSTIEKYTEQGIKTFNWFADDIWRFDNFSSEVCHKFTCCSTTEPAYIEKFKDIGYDNITVANWHCNEDLYAHHRVDGVNQYDVTFIGKLYPDRKKYIDFLQANGIEINVLSNLSFESMINVLATSRICLSFTSNPNASDGKTQMKGRIFEILASGALLLTEYHEGLEEFVEENREAVFFRNEKELTQKLKKLLDKPQVVSKLSKQGFERYLRDHTSKQRFTELLEWINSIE